MLFYCLQAMSFTWKLTFDGWLMWLQIETSILNEETGDVPEDLDGKALLGLEDVCDIIVFETNNITLLFLAF